MTKSKNLDKAFKAAKEEVSTYLKSQSPKNYLPRLSSRATMLILVSKVPLKLIWENFKVSKFIIECLDFSTPFRNNKRFEH